MAQEGLLEVVGDSGSPGGGARGRTVYAITPEGRAEFDRRLREHWSEIMPIVDPFQVALRGAEMIIEARGLRKTYRPRGRRAAEPVEAVRGIDLNVAEGEIFGVLGPNGAGKTTTIRMLATLVAPTGGTATVAGHDLPASPEQVRAASGTSARPVAWTRTTRPGPASCSPRGSTA